MRYLRAGSARKGLLGKTSTLQWPMARRPSNASAQPKASATEPHPAAHAAASGSAISAPTTKLSSGVANPAAHIYHLSCQRMIRTGAMHSDRSPPMSLLATDG